MATTILPANSDGIPGGVTAHHTITVEHFVDVKRPDVHEAVVERFNGVVVCVCCRDVDVREGATLVDAARAYAAMFEADYVVQVSR